LSEADDAAFLALVDAIARRRPDLGSIEAVLLAAAQGGLAADSRGLAKALDVAHAHALRAVTALEEAGLLAVGRRDARSGRAHYALTGDGTALVAAAAADPA
jgi:predicted ArsR family transcriptional regulator